MMYPTEKRVNVRTIRKLQDNEGLTLRNGKIVVYKTGWQVGLYGVECTTPEEVSAFLHSPIGRTGNIGVWRSNGIYYIDVSVRVATKAEAIALGQRMNQQSIYGWAHRNAGQLVWLIEGAE